MEQTSHGRNNGTSVLTEGNPWRLLLVFSLPMLLPATLITRCMEGAAISPRIMLLLIYLWKYTGFHVLLLKMMELTMSPEWIEAAVLEHAGKWQVFCRIKC